MNILLIVPAGDAYRITSEKQEVPQRSMLRFSILPVTAVAGATPPGHHVEICDENVEMLDFDRNVDLVGISIMTATANRGKQIAREFHKRGKLVVAGGYHATLFPEDVLDHFDAVLLGDAEEAWPRLLADAGIGRLQKTYRTEGPLDMRKMPLPRRDLIGHNARHYATTNALQIGRGCKHGCRYCSITAFHRQTYRCRPVREVIEELRTLPREVIFVDDNIVADPDYSKELFRAMAPLKKRWVSQSSLAIADDPELLELAHRAGCRGLFIGIETIRSDNLQDVHKNVNLHRSCFKRTDAIQSIGIGIIAGIIVGMDHDDVSVFEKTLRFLQHAGINAIQLNIMTPLPGTPLYKDLRKVGRITDHDFEHYDFRHCVFRPMQMTSRQLQEGADWLYRQFYRLDRVLLRVLRTAFISGPTPAFLTWKLNRTYRYDNRREGITGQNPAKHRPGRTYESESRRPLLTSER